MLEETVNDQSSSTGGTPSYSLMKEVGKGGEPTIAGGWSLEVDVGVSRKDWALDTALTLFTLINNEQYHSIIERTDPTTTETIYVSHRVQPQNLRYKDSGCVVRTPLAVLASTEISVALLEVLCAVVGKRVKPNLGGLRRDQLLNTSMI